MILGKSEDTGKRRGSTRWPSMENVLEEGIDLS
jgi:hypothetical protein